MFAGVCQKFAGEAPHVSVLCRKKEAHRGAGHNRWSERFCPPTCISAGQRVAWRPASGRAEVCWRADRVCWSLLAGRGLCMNMHGVEWAAGSIGAGVCLGVRRRWSSACGAVRRGSGSSSGRSGRRLRRGARCGRRGRRGVGSRAIRTWGACGGRRPCCWPCGGRRGRRGGCCLPRRGGRRSVGSWVLVGRSGRRRGVGRWAWWS